MTASEREPMVLPEGLRARVLAASWRARTVGRAVPDVPEISPVEAYSRAADALYGMLCALDEAHWRLPVLRGLDVQQLIGHLTGVEEDMRRGLAGDPAVADADHVSSTEPWAARQAGLRPDQTRAEWREAADRTLARVRGLTGLDAEVALHGMRLPVRALLVVRAFELWTHDNDIRRAAGLPLAVPDASTLRLMTELAARLLPYGAARAGLRERVCLHLVLTGPGGGTWDVVIGDRDGEGGDDSRGPGSGPGASSGPSASGGPSASSGPGASGNPGDGDGPGDRAARAAVGIVTGAVGFCQLVANRAAPGDLDLYITGDAGHAARILAAASALALD
jgi:uncharacterized protein (TIGR03083 family)